MYRPTIRFLVFLFIFQCKLNAQTICSATPLLGKVNSPVAAANAKDGTGRLFICEQHGIVRIIEGNTILKTPFLDIQSNLIKQLNIYSERGLLGIAFHPQFKSNRKFYIYFSAKSDKKGSNHKSVVAELKTNNSNQADNGSMRIILEIEEPESNHNGGQLVFGNDGMLYIGVGDGGGANDEHGKIGNGQNIETLLGKIIRIDVNTNIGYKIPIDNPFVGKSGKDEIWALGLRNPWKFSFDHTNGRLFCADVGQDTYEEIDIIEKGKNYGWKVMEGNHCFNPSYNCDMTGLEMPIAEYNHETGKCIIGGYVYRGKAKEMYGKYIFADWTGKTFVLIEQNKNWKMLDLPIQNLPSKFTIYSLAEDESGELYLLGQKGIGPNEPAVIYKLNFTQN